MRITVGKRVQADWTFNLGEMGKQIAIIETDFVTPSIVVLGERNLFVLTESGELRFMKKLDYDPVCMTVYRGSKQIFMNKKICKKLFINSN